MINHMSFNPTYPYDLPLLPPKINWRNPLWVDLLLRARTELGELNGFSFAVPNAMLLLSPAILKESVASSSIENINTTLVEVLQNQLFPEAEQKGPDKEVLHYRNAVLWGFRNLDSLSLSTRLILGIKKHLLPDSHEDYRKQQNRIQNSTTGEVLYTPPLSTDLPKLMSNWENFVNEKGAEAVDPVVKCAVAHYQFEAIHPFNDGNGRTGRILMVLNLIQEGLLRLPILYISEYINKNRSDYYRLLRGVTTQGKWDDFIFFMITGFYLQAKETKNTLFKIKDLFSGLREEIKKDHRKIYSADLVEKLFTYPIITPVKLGTELGIHYTTASRHLYQLAKAGILKEGKYGKYHLFVNERLLKVMKK